jgi:protein SCO1/2
MSISSDVHPSGRTPLSGDRLTFRWWHVLVLLLALVLVALVLFVTLQPVQVLPRMTLAPGYALIDQDGAPLTSEDARGAITLYNFTYTGCVAPACPETGTAMRAIHDRLHTLDTQGIPVRLVTISFDPERDTPAVMKAWAQALGAHPGHWSVATGDPVALKNVIGGGFRAFYEQQPDGTFRFDPAWVLVDGNGIIRARYKTGAQNAALDPEIVTRDLGLLTTEIANSTGPGRLAYEAAHLFLCYPD